jgi:hypothetical protein
MLTRILFDTDKISEDTIKKLKREIDFELDLIDINLGRFGDSIEIYDYLNVTQVKKLFEMLQPKWRGIDEIQINSKE